MSQLTEQTSITEADLNLWAEFMEDWSKFAHDMLGVRLDAAQQDILNSLQRNRKTTIKSGHARGKDFITAVGAVCFLHLFYPSKVILTAPTARQAISIMMAEVSTVYKNANARLRELGMDGLGGEVLSDRIKFPDDPNWFLMAFKARAGTETVESWTGFHSPNIMVGATEASGIEDSTLEAIEGLLTGNSRLILAGNPNKLTGGYAKSFKDSSFARFSLNCLNAPNVLAKKTIYPGQVDYLWVRERIIDPEGNAKAGWVIEIEKGDMRTETYDFEFEGRYFRPSDLCRVKILGEFPETSEDMLIPLAWIEAAFERHARARIDIGSNRDGPLRLGVDVSGMGNNLSVFAYRHGNRVDRLRVLPKMDHMELCGRIINEVKGDEAIALVDTIGEGAGVYSRLAEQEARAISVKFSESAENLTDVTGEREFLNLRAACYWGLRDALDPELGGTLELPQSDELLEELSVIEWTTTSSGKIKIKDKEIFKAKLGRSPDRADAVALTCLDPGRFEVWVPEGNFNVGPSR